MTGGEGGQQQHEWLIEIVAKLETVKVHMYLIKCKLNERAEDE